MGKKYEKHKWDTSKSRSLTPVIQFFLLWGKIGGWWNQIKLIVSMTVIDAYINWPRALEIEQLLYLLCFYTHSRAQSPFSALFA